MQNVCWVSGQPSLDFDVIKIPPNSTNQQQKSVQIRKRAQHNILITKTLCPMAVSGTAEMMIAAVGEKPLSYLLSNPQLQAALLLI